MNVYIEEQIKILCIKSGLTMTDIAKRLNKTPQAFSQKLKRGRITIDDLHDIAVVTECGFECNFILSNGETIKLD